LKALKLITLLALLVGSLYAGTTGKLAGKVTDKETGEVLMGVNIIIEGTKAGAASDVNGEYYIINIPPGIYNVRATMIGYAAQLFEKVRIQVDLTTKLDIQLSSSTLQVGQEVIIVGKKEIQKDLTSSERTIQADQIEALPVRDVASLLSMQAGITRDASGDLHIRGGRTSEISYMVDGVQVVNPINRSAGISIDDQSIEELKAITGTFNAEYGQALSGVVNIVTKKGSEKFTMNATAYVGDHLSFDDDLYYLMGNREWATAAAKSLASKSGWLNYDFSKYGITTYQQLRDAINEGNKPWQEKESYLNNYNPFKRYDLQLNLSGPVPGTDKTISYFAAGRYNYSPGYQMGRRYFMPWGIWQPVSDTLHQFDMPDGKLVPLDWYRGYSTQAKVFFNFTDFNFSYGIYYNNDHSYGGGQKYLPDGGRHYYTTRYTQILSATYIFSASTVLDFKGSYYNNNNKSYLYEDPYDWRYVPTNSGDFQQFMFDPSREDDIEVKGNSNDFSYWGNDAGRSKNVNKYFSFNLDLTSQVNKSNMIKLGASGRFHDLTQDYYTLQFSQVNYRPIVPDVSSAYHTNYSAKPYEFAAYIQDKIEFDELIINVGLRFDYFNSDGRILADPMDPQIYSPFKLDHIYKNYSPEIDTKDLIEYTVAEREAFWYKNVDAKYQFSPRFGLSFPITDRGVIHFSYGHFFQNPEFQYLYTNPNFWIAGAGATNLVGNANLDAERTVMYELGLQQQLFDNLYMHITGFYRDIRDWIGSGFPIDTYRGTTYYSYVNRDNAVAKGITLSTSYTYDELSLKLDYTYMSAKGTASNPQDAYNAISAGNAPIVQLINLNWDQPHSANMIISYDKDGWSGSLIGTLSSGFPYTPTIARGEATGTNAYIGWAENSERRPTTINFDLRISRMFDFKDFRMQVFCDITNLFDTRNARYVYSDTGSPDYSLDATLGTSRLIEISNIGEYFTNSGMYAPPRYISLGLRLSY
jgi:outer membrane receptor for ferrienterochelin and colicin